MHPLSSFPAPLQVVQMFCSSVWRRAKSNKEWFSCAQTEASVLTYGAPTAQSSLSHTVSELNLPSLSALMYAIRNDEKSKKKLSLVVIHFPILLVFGKLLLKYFFILTLLFLFSPSLYLSHSSFFCCNLNGKPPDVCLMLEESEICII